MEEERLLEMNFQKLWSEVSLVRRYLVLYLRTEELQGIIIWRTLKRVWSCKRRGV